MAIPELGLEIIALARGDAVPWSETQVALVNSEDGECNNEGVTDEGIFTVANIKTAIAAAQAITSLANALKMAKLRKKIGDAYAEIAEEQRNYYNDKYKPLEKSAVAEATSWEKPVRNPDLDELNKGQMVISARTPFVGSIEDALRCTGRYCTGQRAAITNDLLTQQFTAEAMVAALADRYNEDKLHAEEDQRWEYRRNVLQLGRGIPAEASAYADLASGVFGSLGNQAGKAAQGAAEFLRYQNKRRDTVYNEIERDPLRMPRRPFALPTVRVQQAPPPKQGYEAAPMTPDVDVQIKIQE